MSRPILVITLFAFFGTAILVWPFSLNTVDYCTHYAWLGNKDTMSQNLNQEQNQELSCLNNQAPNNYYYL